MQRFDPDADAEDATENVHEKENNKLKHLNNKLKRKHKVSVNETDVTAPEEVKQDKENVDEDQPPKKKKKKNKKKQNAEDIEGFTILGDPTDKTTKKVSRVLPHWLSHPDIVTVDLQSSPLPVTELPGLHPALVPLLAKENIHHLFPVQRQVIPHLLGGARFRPSDVCVSAPTGSGKTLAFVLPIVSQLRGRMVPRPRCVAVLPTQELAAQVAAVFLTFTAGTNLRVKQLTGGSGGGAGLEAGLVRRGVGGAVHQLCDILVATPGRLTHAIRECPDLDLSHLRYLVIDEADRMMENIAQDWLNILEAAVYTGARTRPGQLTAAAAYTPAIPLQKLLFSATLSHDPEQLEQLNLFEPKLYRCVVPAPSLAADPAQSLPSSLAQLYAVVAAADKPLAVHQLVTSMQLAKVLVLTHSNDTLHRLALVLAQLGHKVGELHSQVAGSRRKVLAALARGATQVLVCSDVVARGIDLEDLDAVISYDVPAYVKTYIHWVGRTARAGKAGTAVTLCEEKQVKSFLKMLKDGDISGAQERAVTSEQLQQHRPQYEQSLEAVREQLQREKSEGAARNNGKQKKSKFFKKKK